MITFIFTSKQNHIKLKAYSKWIRNCICYCSYSVIIKTLKIEPEIVNNVFTGVLVTVMSRTTGLKCYGCATNQVSGCWVDLDPAVMSNPLYTQTCEAQMNSCIVDRLTCLLFINYDVIVGFFLRSFIIRTRQTLRTLLCYEAVLNRRIAPQRREQYRRIRPYR